MLHQNIASGLLETQHGFKSFFLNYRIWETLDLLMSADKSNSTKNPPLLKIRIRCYVSGVMCQVSCVTCRL